MALPSYVAYISGIKLKCRKPSYADLSSGVGLILQILDHRDLDTNLEYWKTYYYRASFIDLYYDMYPVDVAGAHNIETFTRFLTLLEPIDWLGIIFDKLTASVFLTLTCCWKNVYSYVSLIDLYRYITFHQVQTKKMTDGRSPVF